MAQHAKPKPIGQIDDSRAQFRTRSMLVVMKLSSNLWSIRPMRVILVVGQSPVASRSVTSPDPQPSVLKKSEFLVMKSAHLSGVSSSEKIASTGQAGTQAPQSMHSSG